MNEILDKIVSNNLIFGGLLTLLGVVLIVLIVSIVRNAKKMRKIPIYEEEPEDKKLKKAKEKNIIDPPAKKKKKRKKVVVEEKKKPPVEKEEVLPAPVEEKEEITPAIEEEPEIGEELIGEPEITEEVEEYSEEKIAELESIDEEEIKERIDKEHEEAIKETMEEIDNEEMNDVLRELKDAKEVRPEDVVRQFEQEQEAQSIISYQELVDVVKNRDKEFEDELESKPLATVSDFLPEAEVSEEPKDTDMAKLIEELRTPKEEIEELKVEPEEEVEELESIPQEVSNDNLEDEEIKAARAMVKEAFKEIPQGGKFKKTELISPVFGRIQEESEDSYPTVKKFSHEEGEIEEEEIEEIKLPEEPKDDTIEGQAAEMDSIEDVSEDLEEESLFEEIPNELEKTGNIGLGDISKNEDFLKALKDFRDSL